MSPENVERVGACALASKMLAEVSGGCWCASKAQPMCLKTPAERCGSRKLVKFAVPSTL
jgi:hypothetical protein